MRELKSNSKCFRALSAFGFALITALSAKAAEVDISKLPPPAAAQIDFARDIKPIFERSCFRCHGSEKPKSHFSLSTRESALKGGDNGVDIIPGDSARSPLIHNVARLVADLEMPPSGKGDPLTTEQVGLLRAWIDQGAKWETAPPESPYRLDVSLRAGWTTTGGYEKKFRELQWQREGWNGGIENYLLAGKPGEASKLTLEGHALRDDYRALLALEKNEFGFARFGWEQNRKYFDDSGGYYSRFNPAQIRSDRDSHLDWGHAWADFGLTLPNWPRMVLGYEYQYRYGEKSTLQWGVVKQGFETDGSERKRNISPASKAVDERVHIIKFDLDHEIGGVRFEDRFRGEFADLKTSRANLWSLPTTGAHLDVARERYKHFEGVNTFRVEKQFTDWSFGSLGYLYSKLDADAAFDLRPVSPLPSDVFFVYRWRANDIVLEQQSHVLNLSGQLGPFDGLTISGGVMSEWTRQTAFGNGNLDTIDSPAAPFNTNANATFDRVLDKSLVEEKVAVRYTKIPFTVLFAEARLQQESTGDDRQQIGGESGGSLGFVRRTDVTGDLQDFRAGFNTSPWRWVSLSAHYRRYEKKTDFDNDVDQSPFSGGEGYPAFIRLLDRQTDEVETKLVLRPASWLRTTLTYKIVANDYETVTDPAPKASPSISDGGRIHGRNHDANIFSANLTFTPWQRFYLSTTFSYQQTRTVTAANNSPSVVPFRGDIYSVLASANYSLNLKTDLRATYSFSTADYGQKNSEDALPLGIVYEQHGVRAGLTHRINKNVATALQYAFYLYDEPGRGRLNDYTAHTVFGTLSMALP